MFASYGFFLCTHPNPFRDLLLPASYLQGPWSRAKFAARSCSSMLVMDYPRSTTRPVVSVAQGRLRDCLPPPISLGKHSFKAPFHCSGGIPSSCPLNSGGEPVSGLSLFLGTFLAQLVHRSKLLNTSAYSIHFFFFLLHGDI